MEAWGVYEHVHSVNSGWRVPLYRLGLSPAVQMAFQEVALWTNCVHSCVRDVHILPPTLEPAVPRIGELHAW